MSIESEDRDSIGSLVERLSQTAPTVDKDDLSGLAKMHGWCEALAEIACPDGEQPCAPLLEQIKTLIPTLESIILGEAEDPQGAIASVVEAVAQLAPLTQGQGTGSDKSAPLPSEEEPASTEAAESDEEVAAKLAGIFDEEPSSADASSEVDAASVTNEKPAVAAVQNEPKVEPAEEAAVVSDTPAQTQSTSAAEPPYEPIPLEIDEKELEFVKAFVEEAGEHIEAIEAVVLEVERSPGDSELIDSLFRPFHTIKGMAGFLNLRDVNCVTHEVETLLDQGRKGTRAITPGLIDLVFEVVDILKAQIGEVAAYLANPEGGTIPQPPVVEMIGRLREVVAGRLEPEGRQPAGGAADQPVGENLVQQGAVEKDVVADALEKQKEDISGKTVGQILVAEKEVTPQQVSQALRPQAKAPAGAPQSQSTPTAGGQASVGDQSVRIDTAKLDALVDMVGELVIAQTQVSSNNIVSGNPKLNKDVAQVGKIVRDVQEVSMGMRMIPIGGTFQKMARLVRDVSRKAGKKVELVISGEETELDKNVIQQIGDPLVHMVRNAVDHGIEPPDVRRATGKDEVGHVYLSAFHHGGNIVIEIRDDGKGLDPAVLVAKAIEKGIVQPGEELADQQAYHLVFAPGFSTAAQVTDISGRGVGMDVVRRNIEQLRGKTEITSELGRGSTFSIRLPLTLAIIDGMVVQVGSGRFIISTVSIEQSLRPSPEQITSVQHQGEVLNIRGRLIPLVQLGALFGLNRPVNPCEAMVIVAQCDGEPFGLVVEELIGQQQVVIKTLGERFEDLQGISGAAILGDGRVGLILEMSGIVVAHSQHRTSRNLQITRNPRRLKPDARSTDDDQEVEPGCETKAPALAIGA